MEKGWDSSFYEKTGDKPLAEQLVSNVLFLPSITFVFWTIVLITLFILLLHNFRKNKRSKSYNSNMSMLGELFVPLPSIMEPPEDSRYLQSDLSGENFQSDVTADSIELSHRRKSLPQNSRCSLDQMFLNGITNIIESDSPNPDSLEAVEKGNPQIWDIGSPTMSSPTLSGKETPENMDDDKFGAEFDEPQENPIQKRNLSKYTRNLSDNNASDRITQSESLI